MTPRSYRDDLLRVVRGGRRWLECMDASPGALHLPPSAGLHEMRESVVKFCTLIESVAKQATNPGHPRTSPFLEIFLGNMIGIAKRAKVFPSTSGRGTHHRGQRNSPFFAFVKSALAIARDVIDSSSLADERKRATLSILRVQSDAALSKILERLRTRIGDYRETPHGLVQWKQSDHSRE